MSLDTLEKVRGTIGLYPHHHFPRWHSSRPRETFLIYDFSYGECVSEYSAFPTVQDAAKEDYFSLTPHPECYCIMSYMTTGQEEAKRASDGTLCIKGTRILLTVSRIPSRSLPMSSWENLPWKYPKQNHGYTWHFVSHSHTLYLVAGFLCMLPIGKSKLWQRAGEHAQKSLPKSAG